MADPGGKSFTAEVVGRWDEKRALLKLEDGSSREIALAGPAAIEPPDPGKMVVVTLDDEGALVAWEPAGALADRGDDLVG